MLEFPKLYTEFAKYYDRLESQYRDYPKEVEWLSKILDEQGSRRVIDISCGTGNHITRLADAKKEDRMYFAMDASRQMLDIARRKAIGTSKMTSFILADFLNPPFAGEVFDAVLCMYWSLAGLSEELVHRLFLRVNSILETGGLFVFDVENSDGIKENLLGAPFIDAFFPDEEEKTAVIRANFSTRSSPDVVDWRAYYLIESGGVSELHNDRMNLRFYSKTQLEKLLNETGFRTLQVLSGPFKGYEEHSPSLYFVAKK